MANVNLFELKDCLEGLVPFVDTHADKHYVQDYGDVVQEALVELREAIEATDVLFFAWRQQEADAQLALKYLHKRYKTAKEELSLLGVQGGYPDYPVDYLDEDKMEEAGREMLDFLTGEGADYDFSEELAADLKKYMEKATEALDESMQTRLDYQKLVSRRISAIESAQDVIRSMRIQMRADLGRKNQLYAAVPWPYAIAPD